jgi:Protein of unknown function (DUF3105)
MTDTRVLRVLEVVAIGVASLALSIVLILLLSGYFAGRDQASVSGTVNGPGAAYTDLGNASLRPGELRPAYDSNPPTSGAHVPQPVLQDGAQLNDNQLLTALSRGNVVFMYGGRKPPGGLEALAHAIAGPFTPALARAGQAVILAERPGTNGILGLAWTRIVQVSAPQDPLLREFAQYWLGRGAPGH